MSVVDEGRLVSSLTVGELLDLLQLREKAKQLEDTIKKYEQHIRDQEDLRGAATRVFADVELLTEATVPFEVKTVDDIDKLAQQVKQALSSPNPPRVLMSMAIVTGR